MVRVECASTIEIEYRVRVVVRVGALFDVTFDGSYSYSSAVGAHAPEYFFMIHFSARMSTGVVIQDACPR